MGTEKPKQREMKGIWVHIGYLENLANITGKIEWLSLSTSILVVEKQNKCFQIDLYEYFHWNSVNKKTFFCRWSLGCWSVFHWDVFDVEAASQPSSILGKILIFFRIFRNGNKIMKLLSFGTSGNPSFLCCWKYPFRMLRFMDSSSKTERQQHGHLDGCVQ